MNRKSLYVHVPFCRGRCDYCDFFSTDCGGTVPDEYVQALLEEAAFYVRLYAVSAFRTVYLGGGTPSLLSPAQLTRLLEGLWRLCPAAPRPEEVTVEMNPESASREKLLAAQDSGATRLSLGVQSLSETALRAVHRRCTAAQAESVLAMVQQLWHGDVNLDAIAGLPGQDEEEFLASLRKICSCKPQHVSLYTLTLEEGTPLARRVAAGEAWDGDAADAQWLSGRTVLESLGLQQYEVSNFARAGHESRHNMVYWTQQDYIGIGAGAAGSVYDFSGAEPGMRWTNTCSVQDYCRWWNAPGAAGKGLREPLSVPRTVEELPLATEEFEFLMMGLRTLSGVSDREYRARFSAVEPWKGDLSLRLGLHGGLWEQGIVRGDCLCRRESDGSVRYAATKQGILFLNSMLRYLT